MQSRGYCLGPYSDSFDRRSGRYHLAVRVLYIVVTWTVTWSVV